MLVGDTPRAAVRDIALRFGVQKDEKARAPTWCAKKDERTSAPILWAEVNAMRPIAEAPLRVFKWRDARPTLRLRGQEW